MTKAIARDPIYRPRRFQPEKIELCARWYLRYRLSYRDLVEMMAERGITVSQDLAQWVRVPRGACSGLERHRRTQGTGWRRRF